MGQDCNLKIITQAGGSQTVSPGTFPGIPRESFLMTDFNFKEFLSK
jgi:hypothetical protein